MSPSWLWSALSSCLPFAASCCFREISKLLVASLSKQHCKRSSALQRCHLPRLLLSLNIACTNLDSVLCLACIVPVCRHHILDRCAFFYCQARCLYQSSTDTPPTGGKSNPGSQHKNTFASELCLHEASYQESYYHPLYLKQCFTSDQHLFLNSNRSLRGGFDESSLISHRCFAHKRRLAE
mgnify:CR=1 FL=1